MLFSERRTFKISVLFLAADRDIMGCYGDGLRRARVIRDHGVVWSWLRSFRVPLPDS